jgi:hypothetical protein
MKSDGTAWSWGHNWYGQLGDGDTLDWTAPVAVFGFVLGSRVAAGRFHAAAVRSDSTVHTWGDDEYGQLGDGDSAANALSRQVIGLDTDAPEGWVTIAAGADWTTSQDVTLTIEASDADTSVSKMRVSSDGVFDVEPWEPYVTSKPWTLGGGDGVKKVYVRFRDPLGNVSASTTDIILLDTTGPTVESVTFSPALAAASDPLEVNVDAFDLTGVTGVTADGTALTLTDSGGWMGEITGAATTGEHSVTITATDIAGHTSSSTGTYRIADIVAIPAKSLMHPLTASASSKWLFRLWGRVTRIDEESIYLDDGTGVQIKVICPGCLGFFDGDYISIRGVLDVTTTPITLKCRPQAVAVYY